MIVLDTNMLPEALRPIPEVRVLSWLVSQPRSALFTTTVTRGEAFFSIQLLFDGARRQGFQEAKQAIFNQNFAPNKYRASALMRPTLMAKSPHSGRPQTDPLASSMR